MYLTHVLQVTEIRQLLFHYNLYFHVMIVGPVVDGNPCPTFCTTSTRILVTTIMELYAETDFIVFECMEKGSMPLVIYLALLLSSIRVLSILVRYICIGYQ